MTIIPLLPLAIHGEGGGGRGQVIIALFHSPAASSSIYSSGMFLKMYWQLLCIFLNSPDFVL